MIVSPAAASTPTFASSLFANFELKQLVSMCGHEIMVSVHLTLLMEQHIFKSYQSLQAALLKS
jgi:hypothetical protein